MDYVLNLVQQLLCEGAEGHRLRFRSAESNCLTDTNQITLENVDLYTLILIRVYVFKAIFFALYVFYPLCFLNIGTTVGTSDLSRYLSRYLNK